MALCPLLAQTPSPAAPAEKSASDAESKLAVVLRSYALLDAEADRLKSANARLIGEKAALEAKLAEVQAAVPLASQVSGLRDQLRQTQAQMAAYAEENLQLRNKVALGSADSNRVTPHQPAPLAAPVVAPDPTTGPTAAAPASRTHVVVAGDTLAKISQAYYGTPNRWSEIREANQLRDEKSLVIGRTIIVP
ncbi:MAG: LysM domain-containing protein [Opitutaceae bacterium]